MSGKLACELIVKLKALGYHARFAKSGSVGVVTRAPGTIVGFAVGQLGYCMNDVPSPESTPERNTVWR